MAALGEAEGSRPPKRPKLISGLQTSSEKDPGVSSELGGSDTQNVLSAKQGQKESYYSANFKSVLKAVLSTSPERGVISSEAIRTVERFLSLSGELQLC